MKYILRTTIFIICLIGMMSGIASATIEEEWPFGVRNPLPDDPTYVRFDFEKNSTYFGSYEGVVNFVNLNENKWASIPIGARGYHIYPMDFFYKYDNETRTQVDYIYVVNGKVGAQPVFWRCTNVKCDWWPGNEARIEFPSGASDISFLISNGDNVEMKAYDKTGKFIGSSGIAPYNIYRVPPNPSNFTRVSIITQTSSIYAVEIRAINDNYWLIDDIVVGGLTFPDKPTNYSWVSERLKLLVGAPHNPIGFGYEFQSGIFYPADDIINNPLVVNWDYEFKEWVTGEGINNEGAIIWAVNEDFNLINNLCINDMASKDFKVSVEYGDQKPGDVAFIEYDITATDEASMGYDEIIMFIEPQINLETGATEDCIRILEEDGVHYADSEFLHALYGTDYDITPISLFTVKRLPDSPKGNMKSPYPNIPGKYKI